MDALERRMAAALKRREEEGTLRRLPPVDPLIDFSSNDYLGLSTELAEWPPEGQVGRAGATGSRLLSGNSQAAEELEAELAAFHQAGSGLLFTSGYVANIGLMASLPRRGDTILYDQLIHASLRDGIRLSHARSFSFHHNDLDHLESRLAKATGQSFIVVESLYSMDGDEAPLRELAALSDRYGAVLVVDEAHATGLFGPQGEGLVVDSGLAGSVWCRVHTFGKALGTHGAVVVGPEMLKPYLVNFSRSFIYTTALPPAQLDLIREGYRRLKDPAARGRLHDRIRYFRELLPASVKKRMIPARGPIQSLIVGGNRPTRELVGSLRAEGFDLKAILHPTVPAGTERIRVALHSFNSEAEIRKLVSCVEQYLSEERPSGGSETFVSSSAS